MSKISILMLEDDPDWVEIVRNSLNAKKYGLSDAKTIEEAMGFIMEKECDLAIVDLNLKDKVDYNDRSGYHLIENLQKIDFLQDIPIIILSRFDDEGELRKGFKTFRVYDFISKSDFLPTKFEKIVDELVDEELEL